MSSIKERLEANIVYIVMGASVTAFGLGYQINSWVNNSGEYVEKDSYIKKDELRKNYVRKEDYDSLLSINKNLQPAVAIQMDDPDNPVASRSIERTEILPNDSIDYYGIVLLKNTVMSALFLTVKNEALNAGLRNTHYFKGTDGNFYVVNYGYACVGKGLRKSLQTAKSTVRSAKSPEIVDLRTLSANGFVKHSNDEGLVEYYQPK